MARTPLRAPRFEHPPPRHRRPHLTLYRYIASETLRPILIAAFGLTAIVLTASLLNYSELILNRGVGSLDVALLLFYEAVPVATRMLPFATLVGCLVALGRLGAEREILALEASGVAAARLVWPMVSLSAIVMLVCVLLSVYAIPWANRSFDDDLRAISRARPWATMRPGVVNEFGGWQLESRQISADGRDLEGVLMWIPSLGETVFARAGRLSATEAGAIEITLEKGSVILSPKRGRLQRLGFEKASTVLPDSDSGLMRKDKYRLPGMPMDDLLALAREFVPSPEQGNFSRAALEFQRRLAYPFATLVFGFLAVPLFVVRGNHSRSGGSVLGLVATLGYYALIQYSEGLVHAGAFGPALGAWFPNLIYACVATALLFRALQERMVGRRDGAPWLERLRRNRQRARDRNVRAEPRRHALQRYVALRFCMLVATAFGVLFVAYLMIDMMDRLAWFTRYEATGSEILRFYGARIWLLASRAVPMAVLVGMALLVSLLAVDGELLGMRACGVSTPRALLPALLLTLLIAPGYFLLNNVVVPKTNALADVLKQTEIKEEHYRRAAEERKAGYWYRSGNQVLEAALFDPERGQARDLAIYDLDAEGLPVARTDAVRGRHIGDGWWRLEEATRVDVDEGGGLDLAPVLRFAQLGQTVEAEVDTMHLSAAQIAEEARALETEGQEAGRFWADYYARLLEPIALLVLPAAILFFAVGGPPFPGPAQNLLIAGVLGVAYILFGAVATSLGRGGSLPPFLAAAAPLLLLGAIASALALRVRSRS